MILRFLVALIQKREQVWTILKSNDSLGLTTEAHLALLRDIHDSKDKPATEQHPLYKVLFKGGSTFGLGLFQGTQDALINELAEILSGHDKHFTDTQLRTSSRTQ